MTQRIKDPSEGLALIYAEILSVLHRIVERMENMSQLRTTYGSGPLEELDPEIYTPSIVETSPILFYSSDILRDPMRPQPQASPSHTFPPSATYDQRSPKSHTR